MLILDNKQFNGRKRCEGLKLFSEIKSVFSYNVTGKGLYVLYWTSLVFFFFILNIHFNFRWRHFVSRSFIWKLRGTYGTLHPFSVMNFFRSTMFNCDLPVYYYRYFPSKIILKLHKSLQFYTKKNVVERLTPERLPQTRLLLIIIPRETKKFWDAIDTYVGLQNRFINGVRIFYYWKISGKKKLHLFPLLVFV